jgi:hypothetical protein
LYNLGHHGKRYFGRGLSTQVETDWRPQSRQLLVADALLMQMIEHRADAPLATDHADVRDARLEQLL